MAKLVAEVIVHKKLLALLHRRECSRKQLIEATGLTPITICRWLATYHNKPENLIYISRYRRSTTVGPYTEFYSYGYCMEDVPRPVPLTKKQKNLKTRNKLRTILTPEGAIRHVAI